MEVFESLNSRFWSKIGPQSRNLAQNRRFLGPITSRWSFWAPRSGAEESLPLGVNRPYRSSGRAKIDEKSKIVKIDEIVNFVKMTIFRQIWCRLRFVDKVLSTKPLSLWSPESWDSEPRGLYRLWQVDKNWQKSTIFVENHRFSPIFDPSWEPAPACRVCVVVWCSVCRSLQIVGLGGYGRPFGRSKRSDFGVRFLVNFFKFEEKGENFFSRTKFTKWIFSSKMTQ